MALRARPNLLPQRLPRPRRLHTQIRDRESLERQSTGYGNAMQRTSRLARSVESLPTRETTRRFYERRIEWETKQDVLEDSETE
jgi:hypothetical protein